MRRGGSGGQAIEQWAARYGIAIERGRLELQEICAIGGIVRNVCQLCDRALRACRVRQRRLPGRQSEEEPMCSETALIVCAVDRGQIHDQMLDAALDDESRRLAREVGRCDV